MKKIVIVGCPASGKTTLANKLGTILNIPVFHLDKIFWVQKGGIKQDLFLDKQKEIMEADKWIMDGNFMKSKSYDFRLESSDVIILFKLSKFIVYWRLFKRFIKYFNKLRPDMSGENKFHIDWHIIKFIWNYPINEEYERVLKFKDAKKIFIISNSEDEKSLINQVLKIRQNGL